jgi:hypothetical protein
LDQLALLDPLADEHAEKKNYRGAERKSYREDYELSSTELVKARIFLSSISSHLHLHGTCGLQKNLPIVRFQRDCIWTLCHSRRRLDP